MSVAFSPRAALEWETERPAPSDWTEAPGGAKAVRDISPLRPALSLPPEIAAALMSGTELREKGRRAAGSIPTGLPAFDGLLPEGGLPRGALVELVGRRSSGRFAIALAALASATSAGENTSLVDLGDHLDPQTAAACGVDLARLLWLRPANLDDALESAEIVLGAGFALVVLDLGLPGAVWRRRRGAASTRLSSTRSKHDLARADHALDVSWRRLANAAREHEAALLVSTPFRASGGAATAVLEAGVAKAIWEPQPRLALRERKAAAPVAAFPTVLLGDSADASRVASAISHPGDAPSPRTAPLLARDNAAPVLSFESARGVRWAEEMHTVLLGVASELRREKQHGQRPGAHRTLTLDMPEHVPDEAVLPSLARAASAPGPGLRFPKVRPGRG